MGDINDDSFEIFSGGGFPTRLNILKWFLNI